MEAVDKDMVQQWVQQGHSYEWISKNLMLRYPAINRGLSARSVRRFCSMNGIKKLSDSELDTIVKKSVEEV